MVFSPSSGSEFMEMLGGSVGESWENVGEVIADRGF